MSGVLMKLGPHRFEATGPSYESLARSCSGRWQAVKLIGREPAQQFLGAGEVTVTIEGVVYPFVMDGARTITRLEEETASGRAHILVSGYGKVFGRFGVKGVARSETMAFTKGEAQKISFTLDLVRVPSGVSSLGRVF